MRSMTRFFTILAVVLTGFALSTAAGAQDDLIKKIKDRGTIRVALAESLPMQFKDPKSGEWMGFNVDMANDLAKVLEVDVEFVDASWATLIPGLMVDQYDTCMVDMFATPVRATTVLFADPYFISGWKLMVNSDRGFKSWKELNQPGRVLTALSGTADEQMELQHFPKAEVRPLVSELTNTVFLEVASGRADGLLTAEVNIRIFMSQNPQAKVEILEPERTLSPTAFAYPVRPGAYHFLNFLNTWVSFQSTSGRVEELRKKWLVDYFGLSE